MRIKIKKNIKIVIASSLFLLLTTGSCKAQDSIVLQGQLVNNTRFAKVVVKKFGVGSFDIAVAPITNGKFRITAPAELEPGVYRLAYSQSSLSEYVDVILNGTEKEISFSLDLAEEIGNRKPVFTQLAENKNWYAYQAQETVQLQKISALQNALAIYPSSTDKIIKQLHKAIAKEQKNHQRSFNAFVEANQGTLAGAMVANKPTYFPNPKDDWRLQDYYRRQHFWDGVDGINPKLINTPLYTEHILNYLRYYMNPDMQFSEEEMNAGFMKSVDTIMNRFGGNEETKKFALQYLQLGFKELGNEEVLQYIDQTYQELASQCSDDTDKQAFDKRMAGYAAMKAGEVAPNIALGSKLSLYDLAAEEVLVVFWASWCPHCIEEMPQLDSWAAAHPNTMVVAISLDEDQAAYEAAARELPNLIHTTDFKKWDGKAVQDYFIYGTPTFILLAKNKKIVGKYSSFWGVKNNVNKP